jgi:hypothetical protein
LPKHRSALAMLAFMIVFLVATFAVSQLTSIAPRVLQGAVSGADLAIGLGYAVVTAVSILVLGRIIYSSERSTGRVKRRVPFLE